MSLPGGDPGKLTLVEGAGLPRLGTTRARSTSTAPAQAWSNNLGANDPPGDRGGDRADPADHPRPPDPSTPRRCSRLARRWMVRIAPEKPRPGPVFTLHGFDGRGKMALKLAMRKPPGRPRTSRCCTDGYHGRSITNDGGASWPHPGNVFRVRCNPGSLRLPRPGPLPPPTRADGRSRTLRPPSR